MMQNNVEYVLTSQEIDLLVESIAKLQIIVDNSDIGMNGEERGKVDAMGPILKPFVEDALNYTVSFPQFVPPTADAAKARNDLEAYRVLKPLFDQYLALLQTLSDSLLLTGASALGVSRAYYSLVASQSKGGIKSASTVHGKLSQYFSRKRSTSDSSEEEIGVNEDGVSSLIDGAPQQESSSSDEGTVEGTAI